MLLLCQNFTVNVIWFAVDHYSQCNTSGNVHHSVEAGEQML